MIRKARFRDRVRGVLTGVFICTLSFGSGIWLTQLGALTPVIGPVLGPLLGGIWLGTAHAVAEEIGNSASTGPRYEEAGGPLSALP
ncbi:MAG: hypothetical protein MO853_02260 [Candidatus Protistobacter heckmanni]|nr:hypothetical protein [Candidatus Protistobacter heckmanni]